MAVTAEQIRYLAPAEIFETPEVVLVEVVSEMESDKLVRARAAKFIGACVAGQQIEYIIPESNLEVQPIESLYDAIGLAAEGNRTAYKMLQTNARTDVVERTIKAGHVIKVDLHVDESGRIQQHGQSMESVQANSLRLTSELMRERTEAEATNAFRIDQLYRKGTLEDYSFVVFSLAADNMTNEQMDDAGFFTDTMSCAIQVTTAKDGYLTTESAFVAGATRPGEARQDKDTIITVGNELNVDFSDKTAAEIINTPILIHNSLIPNGAIDLVYLWDKTNRTFFGEDRPQEDYLAYLTKCHEREQTLQPKVDAIVEELIKEAPTIKNRVHATQRLNKLSGKHMIEQAVFDQEINPRVFGPESALHIVQARIQFEQGNNKAGLNELRQAVKHDNSKSCPTAQQSDNKLSDPEDNKKPKNEEDCEFVSKECPLCHKKNVKTKVTKSKITGDCGCSVKK